jgi:acetyl esterase/lipase
MRSPILKTCICGGKPLIQPWNWNPVKWDMKIQKIQLWINITLSGVGLFLSSWIVIPAPTFFLLPLGVGAPEISPLLFAGNTLLLGFSLLQRQRRILRYVAIAFSLCAMVLCSIPLLQLPAAIKQAEIQMQSALGTNYLTQIPISKTARMRTHPFVLADLVAGMATPTVHHDHRSFTASDGTSLDLEIYRPIPSKLHPAAITPAIVNPAIITIYGGGWQSGEPAQNAQFNTYMAHQGYTVVAIDYRHAPRDRFPTQLYDVQSALEWVRQNAADYEIDSTRIALMGWSAGAHLALLAAYQRSALPIRAVVSYYGPTNLTAGYQNPPVPDPIHSRAVLEAFLGGSPTQFPQQYNLASPVHHVKSGMPPTLLIYGSRDHIVPQVYGQQLYHLLRDAGNKAVLISLPWSEHSFNAIFGGLGNQIALYHTERFLAWALHQ